MNAERISASIEQFNPQWRVIIRPINPLGKIEPGNTAKHEAMHIVAAILTGSHIKEASIIPGPGYLGKTVIGEFNAVAFMAAHAMGCDGTGHDVSVVIAMGHDPGAAGETARGVLGGQEREIFYVSAQLQKDGTISEYGAKQAMEQADNPQTEIEIINSKEEKWVFVAENKNGSVSLIPTKVPDRVRDLYKAEDYREKRDISELKETIEYTHPMAAKITQILIY